MDDVLKNMRFSQFADFVNGFTGERPENQRIGQWAFNLLSEAYPLVAEQIRGSDDDPFYRDELVPEFLVRILTDFVVMDEC